MFTHYSINQMDSTVAALCIISHAKFQSLERSYAGVEHSWTWHHEFATVGWKGEEKKTTSDLSSNVGKTISSIKVILIVITVMLKLTTDRIRFSYSSRCCLSYRNLTRTLKKRKWTGRKIVSKTRKAEQNTAERKTIEAGPFQQQQQKKTLLLFSTLCVLFPLVYFSSSRGQTVLEGVWGGGRLQLGESERHVCACVCGSVPFVRVECDVVGREEEEGERNGWRRPIRGARRNWKRVEKKKKRERGDIALL